MQGRGMKNYFPRHGDSKLSQALNRAGAVLIEGPKGSGKTELAKQHGKSFVHVDIDREFSLQYEVSPQLVLEGETPRVFDEWQVQPQLWDLVRHEVDSRGLLGQFILTGSTAPSEFALHHSGAGRFARITLQTMSLSESGESDGSVKLAQLADEPELEVRKSTLEFADLTARMIKGGWPGWLGLSPQTAQENIKDYARTVAEVDISTPDSVRRDPTKVMQVLRSLSRAVGTEQTKSKISMDVDLSRDTVDSYLEALQRIFISQDQPAWSSHPRSRDTLRKTPKRHLADPAFATAILGLDQPKLIQHLAYTGQLFESQVVHDLRANTFAEVFHGRDKNGNEVDAILETAGRTFLIEIKLGHHQSVIDSAASNLHKFAELYFHPEDEFSQPPILVVITGGGLSYTRKDGVHVIPIGLLG